MRPNITLITLGIKDLKRALAFYRDGLGWPRQVIGDEVAFIPTNGGLILALGPSDLLAVTLTTLIRGKRC